MTGWFMKNSIAVALILLGGCAAPLPLSIQEKIINKIESSDIQQISSRNLLTLQQYELGCKDIKDFKLESLTLLRAVTDEHGRNGMWRSRYRMNACGKNEFGNVLVLDHNGTRVLGVGNPGDSIADPLLQNDVKTSFMLAASARIKDCNEAPKVRNTRVVEAPQTKGDPWREVWVATACGKDVEVPIRFAPDATGTGFVVEMPKK